MVNLDNGTDRDCIFILLIQLNIRICSLNNENIFLRLVYKFFALMAKEIKIKFVELEKASSAMYI